MSRPGVPINLRIWPVRDWLICVDHLSCASIENRIIIVIMFEMIRFIIAFWWVSCFPFFHLDEISISLKMHSIQFYDEIFTTIFDFFLFSSLQQNHSFNEKKLWYTSNMQLNWRATWSTWSISRKNPFYFYSDGGEKNIVRDFCVLQAHTSVARWIENGKFNGKNGGKRTANKSRVLWMLLEMNLTAIKCFK